MKRFLFACIATVVIAGLCSCAGGSGGGSAQGFVSYDANRATGGSVPPEQSGDVGNSIGVSGNTGNLFRTGYIFDGWNSKSDGSGTSYAPGTKIKLTEGILVLFVKWTANPDEPAKYTVSFFAESGAAAYASLSVDSGAVVGTMPTDPTKSGYRFEGWWSGQNGAGERITAATVVSGNMSAYAKWVLDSIPPAPQVTVTYSIDGGQSTYATTSVDQSSSAGSLPVAPSRNGYAFAGWWSGVNGGGSEFTASTTISGDMTVYAKWTLRSYTIAYDVAGGDNNPLNPSTYTIESSAITLSDPSKSGNDFLGWYSENTFVTKVTSIPAKSTGNISLYAKWKSKSGLSVTVSIPPDGSIVFSPATPTCALGETVTITTSDGFASYAWYLEGGLIDGQTSRSFLVDSNEYGSGIYELMLSVTDSRGLVSSGSCRIHIAY